jgi:murein DD-endopeptidase MepM/ murein hydrolase activator NlpD
MNRRLIAVVANILAAVGLILATLPASAQTPNPPPGPVYIVQPGDTLWDIAVRFNVSLEDLISYNSLAGQTLYVGDRIVIPGLEDLSGILSIQTVPLGETLRSLSRVNRVDPAVLVKLNRIVSPTELYAGYGLILLQPEAEPEAGGRASLSAGETLLELAVRQGVSMWELAQANGLNRTNAALPGDTLFAPGAQTAGLGAALPAAVSSASLDPLPLTQGQTAQISVSLASEATLGGILVDKPLQFFQADGGVWVALQGVHVMTEPGLYPLRLDVTLTNGTTQSFEQMVLVEDGYFRQDPILQVEPSTIDPAVTEPENEWLFSLTSTVTPEKYWDGVFQLPVDAEFCIRSMYGNRRSYNGSDFIYFHSGVDYGICSETHPFDIYAPAAGVVVFAGERTVRGNATVIDHGWGIYSGFWHQDEIYVTEGEKVEAGQLIGKIGATGRVTGPHLHWEVWANGVQGNPLQWLEEIFPHP